MREIIVFHTTVNVMGGGELVLFKVLEVLKSNFNVYVRLMLLEKPVATVMDALNTILNSDEDKVKWFFPTSKPNIPKIHLVLSKLAKNYGNNPIIHTAALSSNHLIPGIMYVHHPFHYEFLLESNYVKKLYAYTMGRLADKYNRANQPEFMLFNSERTMLRTLSYARMFEDFLPYTAEGIYNAEKLVVYPPVSARRISSKTLRYMDRRDLVVTISRIEPNKKLEVVPLLAKRLRDEYGVKDASFIIIGRLQNKDYLAKLMRLIKRWGVNVRVFYNVGEEAKLRILSQAKVYLHLMPREHFGIAIAEAMSAGLIPIIHRGSGIARFVEDKWLYDSYEQVPEKLARALSEWSYDYALNISDVAVRNFDEEVFAGKMSRILEDYLL